MEKEKSSNTGRKTGRSYNKGYQLIESQIRYAMANTLSNAEAARWLHVSKLTWRKYATKYIDAETGKNLYDLHRETGANKRIVLPKSRYRVKKRNSPWAYQALPMEDIFLNKHPNYSRNRFKERLIKEGWVAERCCNCGYQERRLYDYEVPLKLNFIDENKKNFSMENIRLLCYNCFFILVKNPDGGTSKQYRIDEVTGEPIPIRTDRKSIKYQMFKPGPYYQLNKEARSAADISTTRNTDNQSQ